MKVEASRRGHLEILEAGCGWHWSLHWDDRFTITGIDLDEKALDRRKHVKKDLHIGIVGDIRDSSVLDKQFDVVTSFFVLEHVQGVEQALDNLVRWVKPGGLLILKHPNPESVYGFFTRWTPMWVHVAYHRYIRGSKTAGRSGYGPYPAYYEGVLVHRRLLKFMTSRGMEVVDYKIFGKEPWVARLFMLLVQWLTFGKLRARELSFMYVLRKRRAHDRAAA